MRADVQGMGPQSWRSGTCGVVACLVAIAASTASAALDAKAIRGKHTPAPSIVRVENGGLLFTDNPAGVSGTDCGYSLPIGAQTLWLFGDVFLLQPNAPTRNYVGGVSNCALLVPKGQGTQPLRHYTFLTDPKTGLARQVIPNGAGEDNRTRLWAFGSWYDAARRRAYVYYAVIETTGTGAFAFRTVGHGLARADVTDPSALRFERLKTPRGAPFWWDATAGALYGAAVVLNRDLGSPYLYVVGVQERVGRKFGKLARVLKAHIEDPDSYEYYAGRPDSPRWSKAAADAADVDGLTDFPSELSVAYNAYLGGYLAVHSVSIDQRIRLSLASDPWGPYRPIGEIGAPHQAFARAFCYAGKEHPELAEENGRILYITYVDNQRYWLQLLRVTLAR